MAVTKVKQLMGNIEQQHKYDIKSWSNSEKIELFSVIEKLFNSNVTAIDNNTIKGREIFRIKHQLINIGSLT